jgi:hypothetical protein
MDSRIRTYLVRIHFPPSEIVAQIEVQPLQSTSFFEFWNPWTAIVVLQIRMRQNVDMMLFLNKYM